MGFDAPEMKQTCERDGGTWLCGKESREALANWIGDRDVDCVGDERDRYERLLARCSVDGQDVGEWMVSRGLAVAYYRFSYEYERAEHKAKSTMELHARFRGESRRIAVLSESPFLARSGSLSKSKFKFEPQDFN